MLLFSSALMLIVALGACAKKTEQASQTSTDSLLASNPVEQPAGNIAPQTEYQPPAEPQHEAPPAPEPTRSSRSTSRPAPTHSSRPAEAPAEKGTMLAAGTPINVTVSTQISTETAKVGDTWTGEVKEAVIAGDKVVIPAGSTVEGVVTAAQPAQKGQRASLDLAVSSVTIDGKAHSIDAGTESIVAGSTRARNLGAIAGGAAAGALIGKAVGGSGKGALIGGLLGGAAATGAVASSKGYQVTIKEGTPITFNVSKDVRVRT
jgi:hypothetical protein